MNNPVRYAPFVEQIDSVRGLAVLGVGSEHVAGAQRFDGCPLHRPAMLDEPA